MTETQKMQDCWTATNFSNGNLSVNLSEVWQGNSERTRDGFHGAHQMVRLPRAVTGEAAAHSTASDRPLEIKETTPGSNLWSWTLGKDLQEGSNLKKRD